MVLLLASLLAKDALAEEEAEDATSEAATTAGATPAAALLLGEGGATIERPGTVADAGISLGSLFGGDTTLDSGVALEISPYWLTRTGPSSLGLAAYADGGWHTAREEFAVSMATDTADDGGVAVALAAQTTLWATPPADSEAGKFLVVWNEWEKTGKLPENPTEACSRILLLLQGFNQWLLEKLPGEGAELQKKLADAQRSLLVICANTTGFPGTAAACAEAGAGPTAEAPRGTLEKEDEARQATVKAAASVVQTLAVEVQAAFSNDVAAVLKAAKNHPETLDTAVQRYLKEYTSDVDACTATLVQREGWVVEAAVAAAAESSDGTAAALTPCQVSGWVAPGMVRKKWSLVGLTRYDLETPLGTPNHVVSVGLGGGHRFAALTLNLEGVVGLPFSGKAAGGAAGDVTVTGVLGADVEMGKGLWTSAQIGARYPGDTSGSFFSVLGLKYAITKSRSLSVPTTATLAGGWQDG